MWRTLVSDIDAVLFPYADTLDLLEELIDTGEIIGSLSNDKYVFFAQLLDLGTDHGLITWGEKHDIRQCLVGVNGFL